MHSGFWSAQNTLTALPISKIGTSPTVFVRLTAASSAASVILLEQPASIRTARYRLISGDIAFLRQLIYTRTRARTAAPAFALSYGTGGTG